MDTLWENFQDSLRMIHICSYLWNEKHITFFTSVNEYHAIFQMAIAEQS